jgi:hypothetical protein
MRIARGLLLLVLVPLLPAVAQDPDAMTPAASAAKARELIQQAIAALGGQAYLEVRDIHCTGRLASFASQGELAGFNKVFWYNLLPDKARTEYFDKRNIIDVNNGNDAWTLDRGGVTDAPVGSGEQFLESLKRDVDQLFRYRLKEEGMVFRYAGKALLDLKEVDWVEVMDSERRVTRIALDRKTHLPLRAVYQTRHPETRERIEEVEVFGNYQRMGSVMVPMQVWRDRNGRKAFQVYWTSCQFNTGVQESFFTKEALEQQWAKTGGKKRK